MCYTLCVIRGVIMEISGLLIGLDKVCNYIPVASSISNSAILAQKCFIMCWSAESIEGSTYWTYVRDKDLYQSIFLLIPGFGNIIYIYLNCSCSGSEDGGVEEPEVKFDEVVEDVVIAEPVMMSRESLFQLLRPIPGNERLMNGDVGPASPDEELLWAACHENDIAVVQRQLAKGVNPNFFHNGNTPMVTAAVRASAAVVKMLIDAKADCNQPDQYQSLPFVLGTVRNDPEILRVLGDEGGVDVNVADSMGCTALMAACKLGKREVVQFLMDRKADPSIKTPHFMDAFLFALKRKKYDLIPLLFHVGSNWANTIKYNIDLGQRPREIGLHDGTRCHHREDGYDFYQEGPHELDGCMGVNDITPLQLAFIIGAPNELKLHLIENSDLEQRNNWGRNAVHYLAQFASGNPALFTAILQRYQDDPATFARIVNCQDRKWNTPLHFMMLNEVTDKIASFWIYRGVDYTLGSAWPRDLFVADITTITPFAPPLCAIIWEYGIDTSVASVQMEAMSEGFNHILAVIGGKKWEDPEISQLLLTEGTITGVNNLELPPEPSNPELWPLSTKLSALQELDTQQAKYLLQQNRG